MIPQLMTVRYRRSNGRWRRLYLPVLPLALVLLPLLLLVVLAGLVACLIFRISLIGSLRGVGRLLWALPGTKFEVEDGRTALRVSVR
jgi:hypothetical protein